MTKPVPTAATGLSGEFVKFTVPADSSARDTSKVTIKAGQTSSYFQFEMQGNSLHETEVVGELVDGDNLKFHTIVTVVTEGVRKKATQTFNLPSKVTLDHIECTDGGKTVKVHSKSIKQSTAVPVAATAVQTDVDVPIKSL